MIFLSLVSFFGVCAVCCLLLLNVSKLCSELKSKKKLSKCVLLWRGMKRDAHCVCLCVCVWVGV